MKNLEARISRAISHFWRTRDSQQKKQGSKTGKKDYGFRTATTGGKQLHGFVHLINELLSESGLADANIHIKETTLPGYFRPTKEWDLIVVADGSLLASMEFKSQIGPSFGNNFNNRVEEALGSATDLWTAYREGVFQPSQRPWLGYFMLLEDIEESTRSVAVRQPHFQVFEEFDGASYAKRYELFCERLVRERLYDAACLVLSDRKSGIKGKYREPSAELGFHNFAISLTSKASAFAMQR